MSASSNWHALKKTLKTPPGSAARPNKKRKLNDGEISPTISTPEKKPDFVRGSSNGRTEKDMPSKSNKLNSFISFNEENLSEAQRAPGKYLAIDCEMVGVGPDGNESSLARVSIVNYHGAVQLDVFVRQRETVTDWRTFVSGIRPSDMVNAKPFMEVQRMVADLIKDRILIGHAIENDLKALLLSHPGPMVRDTQRLARKSKLLGGSKWPGLKKLIQKEFEVTIQAGEHNSVVDARATMALYRKHQKEWEKSQRPMPKLSSKLKRAEDSPEEEGLLIKPAKRKRIEELEEHPGAGVKGFSSGLTTVVKRRQKKPAGNTNSSGKAWWSTYEEVTPIDEMQTKAKFKIRA